MFTDIDTHTLIQYIINSFNVRSEIVLYIATRRLRRCDVPDKLSPRGRATRKGADIRRTDIGREMSTAFIREITNECITKLPHMNSTPKIQVLAPEPITLLPSEVDGSSNSTAAGTGNGEVGAQPHAPGRRRRASSAANRNFNFSRVSVTDCTIVKGDNGSQFAMWKISVLLQPSEALQATAERPKVASPQLHIYKRYSDFVSLRAALVDRISAQGDGPKTVLLLSKIPKLPPKVPWYEAWKYQTLNFDKKWLIERRMGLEVFLNGVILNRDIVELCRPEILQFLEHQQPE